MSGLDERLAQLEDARHQADRRYNDALTALDRALGVRPESPLQPAPYDATRLPEANRSWDLPTGADAADRSLKGRLRTFVWRIVGPVFSSQRHFNATIVDHLNRNVSAHEQAKAATDALIANFGAHLDEPAAVPVAAAPAPTNRHAVRRHERSGGRRAAGRAQRRTQCRH